MARKSLTPFQGRSEVRIGSFRGTAAKATLPSMQLLALAACGSGVEEISSDVQEDQDAIGTLPAGSTNIALTPVGTQRPLGDSFTSSSKIQGAPGPDTVAVNFQTATIRDGALIDVETLNVVFNAPATFDGQNSIGLSTINLGLDGFDEVADEVASTAGVDLDEMKADFDTLNIHSSQPFVEVDYQKDSQASLSVNFDNDSGDIEIGNTRTISTFHPTTISEAMQILHASHVQFNHVSTNEAWISAAIDLSDHVETISVTTNFEEGDLIIGTPFGGAGFGGSPAFGGTSAVTDISILAQHGDMELAPNSQMIVDAEALQTYRVTANNASIEAGTLGQLGLSPELELLAFETFDTGTIYQGGIYALGADVSSFAVNASDTNTISTTVHSSDPVNVAVTLLAADNVAHQTLNANDGGHIELSEQSYRVDLQVFSGSGDITIGAGILGYVQLDAADAASHTGTRTFIGGSADDVFYGSTGDDSVILTSNAGHDVYLDSDGDDIILQTSSSGSASTKFYDDGTSQMDGAGTATADRYIIDGTQGAGNSSAMQFFAGGGNDVVILSSGSVLVDFADYDSDVVYLGAFTPSPNGVVINDTMSFDGLGSITASSGTLEPGNIGATLDANAVYVFTDGDTPITGGASTISDYLNFYDVASYLNEAFAPTAAGTSAVFVLNNISTSSDFGNRMDFYVYHYVENGHSPGIDVDELQLVALSNTSGGSVTTSDIV